MKGSKKEAFYLSVFSFAALLMLLTLALAACQSASAKTAKSPEIATALAAQANAATQSAVNHPSTPATPAAGLAEVQPTTTSTVSALEFSEETPQGLRDAVELPPGWKTITEENPTGLRLEIQTDSKPDPSAARWVYALVAPFPTVTDNISLIDLQNFWKGGPVNLPARTLLVDPSTYAAFKKLWGPSASAVRTLDTDQILDTAWAAKDAWAIVPFEQLEPRWKVLSVDGQSPVRKDFNPAAYQLTVPFTLHGDPSLRERFLADGNLPAGNRHPDKLTTVLITGVTALVRGTASFMEGRGLDYPAKDIGGWLREADILHISNEVAFAKNCPPPFDWDGLKFCSRPKYIQLLEDVGTDVVELTGDHFSDWGPEAVLETLDMYKERGWKYYGGGANIEEARKPALLEHNGNRIAFIGCNAKPKGYATASETAPGAVHCDMDQMVASIKQLRLDGYQPIVTFQHLEYYSYAAHPILQKDFEQMADAGAAIVSGSQAHQPHAFEFKDSSFLHYGLGNLFFDQTNQGDAPRTAFIDRHVFYNGKHISTELLTIYLVDLARSRPMTAEERAALLSTVFKASGW